MAELEEAPIKLPASFGRKRGLANGNNPVLLLLMEDLIHWKRALDTPILFVYQSDRKMSEKDCI